MNNTKTSAVIYFRFFYNFILESLTIITKNKCRHDTLCKKGNLTEYTQKLLLSILFLTLVLPILSSTAIAADPNGSFRFISWADSRDGV